MPAGSAERFDGHMRKVIDKNAFQSEALRTYLGSDARNFAVITNQASIEAYKGDALRNIYESMAVLSKFPEQVVILKGTQQLCGLNGRGKGLQQRLIDDRSTRDFGKFCKQLERARAGDLNLQRQILNLGQDATEHLNKVVAVAPEIAGAREQVGSVYTDAELRIIRTRAAIPKALKDKVIQQVMLLGGFLFRGFVR